MTPTTPPTTRKKPAGLTPLQQHVLDYLRVFLRLNDQLPTCAAIAQAFGWASSNAASTHLAFLERKGHLTRNELGHLMLAERSHADAAEHHAQLVALRALAADLLHPEVLGYAVTAEVRDRARAALEGRWPQ
ncbi:MAG: hypothetical protein IAE92_09150 [Burkholderiaceae bacterium]|nr:hypothetical protein [Burkholderiaceae bacterium]